MLTVHALKDSRRRPHQFFAAFAWMFCAFVVHGAGLEKQESPDIIVVLCDDLNPFYLGFAGDPDALTPNLDALAEESMVFDRCYTASPVCMSSRTSIVTGLYPHNTGCWGNADKLFVDPELTSLFSDFKETGYSTSVIGKTHWYSGNRFKNQFDSLADYFNRIGIDHFRDVATTFSSRNGSGIYQDFLKEIGKFDLQSADLTDRLATNQYVARQSLLAPEETCDWMMVDLALEHLAETPTETPLAMMIGLSNPHSPFDPAGEYAELYDASTLYLRENVSPFQKYGTNYTLEEIRKARAAYLGKISFIDSLLGRLIEGLKTRGNWENTVLVFTADHGMTVGEHRNISKGLFWEEIARVPLVVRLPGGLGGGLRSEALCQTIDLYPTLIELAGGEVAPHVLGRSLVPILDQERKSIRDAVFCEIHHDGILDYMVRMDQFKWFSHRGDESLYHLEADPYEQTNLIQNPDYQGTARKMRDRLREFLMTEQVNLAAGYRPMAERVKSQQKNQE